MDGNILNGGIEELNSIKDILIELHGYKDKNDLLLAEENKIEKAIKSLEKAVSEEIINTTKKRKDEIELTYNNQIEATKSRIKKIRNKKEKSKHKKIQERIGIETKELRDEYSQMVQESKNIFKQNNVPSFCNTRLFYALFMPKGFKDIIIIIITLLLILLVIPSIVYLNFLPKENMIPLFLLYAGTVILFGGVYMFIENAVKDKHRDAILKVRGIRSNQNINKKKRNKIKKSILKDRDESSYGLEQYNNELKELDNELKDILEQKTEALSVFDNTTKFAISDEIKQRNKDDLEKLKIEYTKVYQETKETEDKIKAISMEIASSYEAYIGKEFMSLEKLDILTNLMTEENISTIAEAIALYKEKKF